MGYAKILWVYEDGIRDAEDSKDQWERLKPEIGEAVLHVCSGEGWMGAKFAPVLGHANCVNLCDEVHSTDARVYLWGANCLRPLHELDEEDFAIVERLVAEERERRSEQ